MLVVGTYAIELLPHPQFLTVTDIDTLYSSTPICISLGYIAITIFCMPAGFLNLEDNVKVFFILFQNNNNNITFSLFINKYL